VLRQPRGQLRVLRLIVNARRCASLARRALGGGSWVVSGCISSVMAMAACGGNSSGATDASSPDVEPDSPGDSSVVDDGKPGTTCTQDPALSRGGSDEAGCMISADEVCTDLLHGQCWCGRSPDGSIQGMCDCEVIDLTTPWVGDTLVNFAGCPSCPSASQAWSICGWPQPQSWTFVCGSTPGCNVGLQFCSVTGCVTDAGDAFSCSPLPPACAPDAAPSGCGCLGPLGNGCACTADGVGNLTVTCCPQDAGAVDALGPDASE